MSRPPHIAITLGDPCGIGPELLLRSLPTLRSWGDVTVVGSRAGVDLLQGTEGRRAFWQWTDAPAPAPEGFLGTACGLEVGDPSRSATALWLDPTPEIRADRLELGRGSAVSGRATVEAIRWAAGMALSGRVDALTTLPMAKSAAHLAGYPIPGHTEFLQTLAGAPIVRMAFVSPRLSVVLHTVHQSLRSVVEDLDAETVAETLAFSASQFIRLTGNPDLRVALCALNPHAGEAGAFGDEEGLLAEARDRAEAAFRKVGPAGPFADLPSPFPRDPKTASTPRFSGPLPSDSLFHRAVSGEFDLVVALYHDQGLIPIKLLEPARAVNLTLGLPYIRTSPDHGTAFDKAGKWMADPRNFLEAAALGVRLAGRARQEPWAAQVVAS
ncbi:MAG TPA: 4-hydroxythreonine-4-phosphate dehydrogenase PdxA [Geothrix sp.]|nr:4-hydroxythreonine-4-phosphate dehydrogenase PdxA [Geothrix sp.]